MTKKRDEPRSTRPHAHEPTARGVSRRTLLLGTAAGLASTATFGILGRARAAGKYKLDLGGYNGPELTTKPITLRFMRQDFNPDTNAAIEAAYAKFTGAYPNIKIAEEKVPYGDLSTKLQLYVASGDAPDIMMGRNDFALSYAAGDIALPLQDYLTKEYVNDIIPNLREAASVDGNLLCVPWETNLVLMYFNKDIFKKAGIETPPEVTDVSAGLTAAEFLDRMEQLTKALRGSGDNDTWAVSASTFGNGGPGSNYSQLESIWVRSQGDPNADDKNSSAYKTFLGVSEDGFKATGYVDTPEAILGMTNYQTMFSKGLTPKGAVKNQFLTGAGAIGFGGLNNAGRFKSNPPGFAWGASTMPRGKFEFSCNSSNSPLVWKGTPHPAEAAALMAYLCDDPNRIAFHQAWGSMPARTSLIEQIPAFKTDQPFKLAAALSAVSHPAPRTPGWFDYFNAINPAVKDIALGADPAATLHDTATRIDGLLAKYQ